MRRTYKEINKEETETTINVLYNEKMISVYTNKIELQRQLKKVLGKAKREDIKGISIKSLYNRLKEMIVIKYHNVEFLSATQYLYVN